MRIIKTATGVFGLLVLSIALRYALFRSNWSDGTLLYQIAPAAKATTIDVHSFDKGNASRVKEIPSTLHSTTTTGKTTSTKTSAPTTTTLVKAPVFHVFKCASDGQSSSCVKKLWKRSFFNPQRNLDHPSYGKFYETFYYPRNYTVQSSCPVHPWLGLRKHDQHKTDYCRNVFKDWIKINRVTAEYPPPKNVPPKFNTEFTMDGIADVHRFYYNQIATKGHFVWSTKLIDNNLQMAKKRSNFWYGNTTQLIYQAMDTIDLTGKRAAVIGSQTPWLEAIIINKNVSYVKTVEYTRIKSEDSRIKTDLPIDIAYKFLNGTLPLYDFIATYSSLEHSGLGRYGDLVDPIGDIREMEKCWCLLKPGGMMLVGVPLAFDTLAWNGRRIYGPYRLPMLTSGFEVVSIFDHIDGLKDWKALNNTQWVLNYANGAVYQNVFLLRKPMRLLNSEEKRNITK